jgi:hypothetical protein
MFLPFRKSVKKAAKRLSKQLSGAGPYRPRLEVLEDRTLLSVPAVSINNINVAEGTAGPFAVSGSLNPGLSSNIYRVHGAAGEQLTFHNVSASSTDANWILYDADNLLVPGSPVHLSITNDFTATLPTTGLYTLVIGGTGTPVLNYSFTVTATLPAMVAPSGFGTVHTGSLAPGASTTFSYTGSAGLLVYFDSQSGAPTVNATLADSVGLAFSYGVNELTLPPVSLPRSGNYTLTLQNPATTAQTYAFRIVALPDEAAPLTVGSTVTHSVSPGFHTDFYRFTGSPGQKVLFNNLQGATLAAVLSPADHDVFTPFEGFSFPITLDDQGTYYLVIQSSGSYSFQFLDVGARPALSFNTAITGILPGNNSAQTYQFFGSAGQRIVFDGQSASSAGIVVLYTPSSQDVNGFILNGQPANPNINGAALNGQFDQVLPGTGTYTLVVSSPTPVNFAFELLTPPTPTFPLTLGSTVSSALTVLGEVDTYTFTGTPGQKLFYDGLGNGFDGIDATLNSPTGAMLLDPAANDHQGPVTLTVAGTYSLVIQGFLGNKLSVGPYSFRLIDAGEAPAQGLTLDTSVAGSLNPGSHANVYEFIGTAGHTLTFRDLSASSNQATWTLYDPSDRPIGAANIQNNFQVTLGTSGIYTLVVAGSAAPAFNYSIQVNDSAPASGFGAVHSGSLSAGAATTFTYTGRAGMLVYFDSQTRSAPDIQVTLADSGGQVFSVSMNANTPTPIPLPRSDTYTLTLHNNAASGETYAFRLVALPAGAGSLTLGNMITQSVASGLRTDFYTFTGQAMQQLFFNGLQGAGANVQLVDPNHNIILNQSALTFTPVTLPQDGTYYLILSSNTVGPYTYSFQLLDPGAQGTLSFNTPISGTLTTGNSQKTFEFFGTVNQWLSFTSLANANGTWNLSNNFDGLIAGGGLSDSFVAQLPGPGLYQLVVTADPGSLPVSYAFEVAPGPASTHVLILGNIYSSSLTVPGQQDTYTFAGTAGQRLILDNLGDRSFPIGPALISPSGLFLGDAGGPFTLSESGTYRLVVSGNLTGPYAFRLSDEGSQPVLNLNSVEATFTVSLSAPAAQLATVQYALAPGATNPAQPGVDYGDAQGQLVFSPGQSTTTVTVLVLSDADIGVNETFTVNLSNPVNATIADGQGTGTILENPAAIHNDIWTGLSASMGGNSNWSTAGNWSLGHAPGPLDTVSFTSGAAFTTSTVDVPFTIASLTVDGTWGGTIAVNADLTITGNYILASGMFDCAGTVTIAGSGSRWTGGKINLGAGGFLNKGTLTMDTTASILTLDGDGVFTNRGTIKETGAQAVVLQNTFVSFINAAGALFDISSDASISEFFSGGPFVNAGTLKKSKGTGVSAIGVGSFSNTGTVLVQTGTLSIVCMVTQVSGSTLTAGSWQVAGNGATLTIPRNITILDNAQVTIRGANASFTNLAGLTTINAGASLSLGNGQSFTITGNFSNAGTVTLAGATLNLAGTVTQVAGNTLTGGTWIVNANGSLNFPVGFNITALGGANVTLNGANSHFAALTNLATIGTTSSLTLSGGRSFTTVANFTNNGRLTIGRGSVLTVNGGFTQASSATLLLQMGLVSGNLTVGSIVTTSGTDTLAGGLTVSSTAVPTVGSSAEILDNEGASGISGIFAGLPEGATFTIKVGSVTMTFRITYKGDAGNDVVITRIS